MAKSFLSLVNQPANPIQTITVTKGTSVRMQWVPSLQGCQLIGQQCGYLSGSSLIALAGKTRTGAFQAVSALPKQFAERVSAISSSHTLVIGNIQFNDTAYRFRCNVQAGFWISRGRSYPQNPTYNLQVVGRSLSFWYYYRQYGKKCRLSIKNSRIQNPCHRIRGL